MKRVRVLIADQQALCARALAKLLSDDLDVIGVALSSSAMLSEVDRLKPDLVLTRIINSGSGFLPAMKTIHQKLPTIGLIVLAAEQSRRFTDKVLSSGATAIVPITADTDSLLEVIRNSAAAKIALKRSLPPAGALSTRPPDGSVFSLRQQQILTLLMGGRSVKEIAEVLHVSPKTVEFHKYRMMRILGTKTLAELIVAGVRMRESYAE